MNLNNKASIILTGLFLSSACMVVTASESGLQITNQWVREAPPMASMLAGYLHIKNNTDGDVVVVGVNSLAFRKIEIHRTEIAEGIARMVQQKRVEVPAKGELAFEQAGYHLMLMKPSAPLKAGDTVSLKVQIEGAKPVVVTAPVKRAKSLD
ncbi:MAG: copper chaperone PCu(A)C [Gammaproteobacteria bacterium]|nr:copper chaperone PCu(A)C [Gammaproteobacteria bacterium]